MFLRSSTKTLGFVILASLVISFPLASWAQHGAVYGGVTDSQEANRAARPQADAFYRIFDKNLLLLSEAKALQFGAAVGEDGTQPNLDNSDVPAGFTFLGQFLDHDMTLNEGKILIAAADSGSPNKIFNTRSGSFDLDSIYGDISEKVLSALKDAQSPADCVESTGENCEDSEFLAFYEFENGKPTGRFKIGQGEDEKPDLLRCRDRIRWKFCNEEKIENRAMIGDRRNAENIIVAQIHLLFIQMHNKLYEIHRRSPGGADKIEFNAASFSYARRMVTEHYQSIIRDEYVPTIIGAARTAAIIRKDSDGVFNSVFHIYRASTSNAARCTKDVAPIPHEFAVAAFRFGHSQVRSGYALNTAGAPLGKLFGFIRISDGLRISWDKFFSIKGAAAPQKSFKIDTILSLPLKDLAPPAIGPGADEVKSLARRNTLRVSEKTSLLGKDTKTFPLISGAGAAAELIRLQIPDLRFTPLTQQQLLGVAMLKGDRVQTNFNGQAPLVEELPLWVYILAEAEALNEGARLGPVGGTIVGEVMLGLLSCDEAGIMRDRFWRPSLPAETPDRFTMADLIRFVQAP